MEAGTRFQKIQAINKAKQYQFLCKFFLYSMAALTCLLFSSVFWFASSGLTSTKFFVSGSLPKFISIFFSYKSIFIFGNLIVIVLIGESKFFAPNHPTAGDVYYNEYINQKRSFQTPSTLKEKKVLEIKEYFSETAGKRCFSGGRIEEKQWCEEKRKVEKEKQDFGRGEEPSLSTEELKRRADDFIQRVNKQRRLEARLLVCYTN